MPGHWARFAATPESAQERTTLSERDDMLFAFPARLALLQERADAFGGVLGEGVHGEHRLQVLDRLLEAHLAHRVVGAAAELEDRRAFRGERLRGLLDLGGEGGTRDDAVRPAEVDHLPPPDLLAGE